MFINKAQESNTLEFSIKKTNLTKPNTQIEHERSKTQTPESKTNLTNKNIFFKEEKNIFGDKSRTKEVTLIKTLQNEKKIEQVRIFGNLKIQLEQTALRKIKPRLNNQKKKKILAKHVVLQSLSKIRTKESLINFFIFLSMPWKNFIKIYLQEHFLRHLFIRPLKNPYPLMHERQFIYESIDNPENFLTNIKFSTNIIKNFCKGIVNFVVLFYDDLLKKKLIPAQ